MEWKGKQINFTQWECKIHGLTDFYTYSDGRRYKCVICAKENSKEWKEKNPERSVSKTIEWHDKNPEKIKAYQKKAIVDSKNKVKERSNEFYEKFGSFIDEISNKIELKKIGKSIEYIKEPTNEKIFNFLMKNKRTQLINHHAYRLSGCVKWHHLKSLNLNDATEEQKIIIREEYRRKAKEITDSEMISIIKKFQ
jgi:hypothetical protein